MLGAGVAGSLIGVQAGVLFWLLQRLSGETIEERWAREYAHRPVLYNRNRNHRNRNFLPCGTGTGTIGTVTGTIGTGTIGTVTGTIGTETGTIGTVTGTIGTVTFCLVEPEPEPKEPSFFALWNRNRNHRDRNFLPCGTGTGTIGTVTFCLVEPEP